MEIRIGTSGFSYGYWRNRFYPQGLASGKWLEYYATQFNSVELNNSFYRFPTMKLMEKLYSNVPEGFKFAVKAHRIITHNKRFRDAEDKVREFEDLVHQGFKDKLGPILYQLPPSYDFSQERLDHVVKHLDTGWTNVVEFRHASWWNEDVYTVLREAGISFCNVSLLGLPVTYIETTPLYYHRMHGVPELFISAYASAEISELRANVPGTESAWVFFNNTMYEAGYTNARELKGLFDQPFLG